MSSLNIAQTRVFGNPQVGVFIFASNEYALIPRDAPEKVEREAAEALGVRVIRASVAGSPLLGIFVVGNSSGVIVPGIAHGWEVDELRAAGLNVAVVDTRYTALSNLVAVNDRVALVSPAIYRELGRVIRDVLGVEAIEFSFKASQLVGSLIVANNYAALVAPDADREEVEAVKRLMKLEYADVGTVNMGSSFVRGGLVVNDRGGLVGDATTGPELLRIGQVFRRRS